MQRDTPEFGSLLRERRIDAHLTQEALAEHAGVSARTIADIERGIIRAPRRDTLDMLVDALGLPEDERRIWRELRRELSVRTSATRSQESLPVPPNPLIGRERELDALSRLVRSPARLVTITGPGGVGKTRFAIEAAHSLASDFAQGVHFIELASVRDPDLMAPEIANQLGVHEGDPPTLRERLIRFIARRRLLLILDNFEHLRPAARDLADLLAHSTDAQFLVTSRASLRISAEHEFPIHPLELPELGNTSSLKELRGEPAIELFLQRARQVRPDLELTSENSDTIARICAHLDGLPLAIELAAARVKVLSPDQIQQRVIDRLWFLTEGRLDAPDRHQTMRAAIAWSHDLLDADTQLAFRRFSTFVGGWTLEAAEAVTPSHMDALEHVTRLCDDSLVAQVPQADGSVRFTMLETVREFGQEQLNAAGESDDARRAHAWFYLALAERAEPGLRGADQVEWINQLQVEMANFRAALQWTIEHESNADFGLGLAAAMSWFWETLGYASEGRDWLNRVLERDSGDSAVRMKALAGAGWFAHIQQESGEAGERLSAALRLAESIGDQWWIAWILHLLGRVAYFDGDAALAEQRAERSSEIARDLGDEWLIAWDEHLLGLAAFIRDDLAATRTHYQRSLEIRESIGYQEGVALMQGLLGVVHLRESDLPGAWRHFRDGLELSRPIGARWLILNWLGNIVRIAAEVGEADRAARLAGFVDSMSGVTGAIPIPITSVELGRGVEIARANLGSDAFDSMFDAGRQMTIDEAIADAMALAGNGQLDEK